MAGPSGEEKPYFYSDASSSGNQNIFLNQPQILEPNSEIYNLTSSMEIIGFPSKNQNQNNSVLWKGLFNKLENHHHHHNQGGATADPSAGKSLNEPISSTEFYQNDQSLMVSQDWINHPENNRSLLVMDDQLSSMNIRNQFQIRSSKYLDPAQELLNEFCNLGTKQSDDDRKMKVQKNSDEWLDENNNIRKQSLHSLDFLELQKRKSKLLHMLEQVDRRYKHYCDQMKAVVQSFEAVAGNGAGLVYSSMASKAMSRHFRCLRDGIVSQIKETKKAMGEKDYSNNSSISPGITKGETPRLRVLDQTLRAKRAFQQIGFMETHPWRPQRGLPEPSVAVLRAWLFEHFLNP
ncbi:hypothetical protein BUALT_Bualt05G0052300 [Buddleja alternifolia]|uniref:POX domain-containing protein n=1 Tax=Buddleja alternifolia TaxID=168488 RepID=A0AAV6XIC8_9LAMI|nr:hypothetical protein BUALT_Bualt05G0052300 [Buddleja alternifolia]